MNEKEKEKLIEAVRVATNGTFIGERAISTLMGWSKVYDDEGRLITPDPNYIDSSITIDDITYKITKHKWNAYIWKPEVKKVNYMLMLRTYNWREEGILAEVDLKPEYVKEWEEKHKYDNKQDKSINTNEDGYIYLPFEMQTHTPTIVNSSIEDLKKKKIKVYESKESD